jgi:hypothetical protein
MRMTHPAALSTAGYGVALRSQIFGQILVLNNDTETF